MDKEIKN